MKSNKPIHQNTHNRFSSLGQNDRHRTGADSGFSTARQQGSEPSTVSRASPGRSPPVGESTISSSSLYPTDDDDTREVSNSVDSSSASDPTVSTTASIRPRPSSCIFVASLSSMLSDDELNQSVSEYFERFGEIVLVKVLRDAHNRPYAFVQFSSDGEANEALEHGHHAMLNGRRIRCERARVNRTLFCTPLIPGNASLDRIKEKLETFGETEDIMAANNVGRRPAWFVKFVYRDDAIRAYANLTSDPAWRVEWAQNVDRMRVCIDTRSVFVSSLSPDTTEKLLEERFGRHGAIETCRVYSKTRGDDSTGSTSLFGYVTYRDDSAAAISIEHENHTVFLGTTIHVQYKELRDTSRDTRSVALAPPPVSIRQRTPHNRSASVPLPYYPRSSTSHYRSVSHHPRASLPKVAPLQSGTSHDDPHEENATANTSQSSSSDTGPLLPLYVPKTRESAKPAQVYRTTRSPGQPPPQHLPPEVPTFYPMGYYNPYMYYPPRDCYPYWGGGYY